MSEETQTLAGEAVMVRVVQVDVYAYREGDDILFSHAWRRQGDANRQTGKIAIPHGEGDVPIHFHLHDRTGLQLEFLPVPGSPHDATDAMWVAEDDCPTGPGNCNQITFDPLSPKQLRISDANSGAPTTLHYALRFTGDAIGAGPPYEYDPIIKNGGGG